jgi:mRNA interferase MazF
VLILQADIFDETNSITICGFTSDDADTPFTRPLLIPNAQNGLLYPSRVMVDKITTVPRERLRAPVGSTSASDMVKVDSAIATFLAISL